MQGQGQGHHAEVGQDCAKIRNQRQSASLALHSVCAYLHVRVCLSVCALARPHTQICRTGKAIMAICYGRTCTAPANSANDNALSASNDTSAGPRGPLAGPGPGCSTLPLQQAARPACAASTPSEQTAGGLRARRCRNRFIAYYSRDCSAVWPARCGVIKVAV